MSDTSDAGSEVMLNIPTDTQPDASANTEPTGTPAADPDASREAAKAGESRKRMAENLLSLAEKDPSALAQLKSLTEDSYERTYFERKFGEKFTSLLSPKAETAENIPPELGTLLKERDAARASSVRRVKENLGLTSEDSDKFNDLVKTFEGQKIGGVEVSFEEAVSMAARQIRPSLPSGFNVRSDMPVDSGNSKDEIKVGISEERIKANSRYTGAKSEEDFVPILSQVAEKGYYNPLDS